MWLTTRPALLGDGTAVAVELSGQAWVRWLADFLCSLTDFPSHLISTKEEFSDVSGGMYYEGQRYGGVHENRDFFGRPPVCGRMGDLLCPHAEGSRTAK